MGSNDHERELIDVRKNMNETNYEQICHFECQRRSGYYRFIRFIQLDSIHILKLEKNQTIYYGYLSLGYYK